VRAIRGLNDVWISNGWAYLAFTVSFALMAIYAVAPMFRPLAKPATQP